MDATGLPSGTVYPMLRRLEKEGLVRADVGGHRDRARRTAAAAALLRADRRRGDAARRPRRRAIACRATFRARAASSTGPPSHDQSPPGSAPAAALPARRAARLAHRPGRRPRAVADGVGRGAAPSVVAATPGCPGAGEMHMVRRSLGSLVDAAWIRRQLTTRRGRRPRRRARRAHAGEVPGVHRGRAARARDRHRRHRPRSPASTDALLFRPLPIPDADRVVTLWERNRATGVGRDDVAPGNAIDWVTRPASFAAAAAVEPWSRRLHRAGRRARGAVLRRASPSDSSTCIGVPMLHGRAFLPREFIEGQRSRRRSCRTASGRNASPRSVRRRPRDPARSPAVRRRRRHAARHRSAAVRGAPGAARLPHRSTSRTTSRRFAAAATGTSSRG